MPDDPVVDPQPGPPPPPQRPTKEVTPQPAVVQAIPWWQSVQMRWALGVVASSFVGVIHAVCKMFGYCILQKVEVGDLAVLLFSVVSFVGGLYWLFKRVKVGNDPTNTSAPITLK